MKSPFPSDLDDNREYRPMVRWFSPLGLLKTLEKVVPSTLFGQYADGRVIHAALDVYDPDTVIDVCCGGAKGVCGVTDQSAIWLDYVADLGDGFDSTYAIAYLIGQKELHVGGETLPRAHCLVMGGDEVYPDASRDDYHKRLLRPYKAAFPRTDVKGAKHPPMFLLPGNHDWYDGLVMFSALFCNRNNEEFGSWVTPQRRSYFATHLGNDWWVWGFDSQLHEDVDRPQSEYFDEVAKRMAENSKVILCASVPTWANASMDKNSEDTKRFGRGVHFIASKLYKHRPAARIPLVLAGDTHHYNRFISKETGTQFVTAGGGGAFLHPTHDAIKDSINFKWLGGTETTLEIASDAGETKKKAIYPTPARSKELALRNFQFPLENWDFSLFMGGLYLIISLMMLSWRGYGEVTAGTSFLKQVWYQAGILWPTPIFILVAGGFLLVLWLSSNVRTKGRRVLAVSLHFLFQIALLLFGTAFVSVIAGLIAGYVWERLADLAYFGFLVLGAAAMGFVGGFLWGSYLALTSFLWGAESNSAFSALRYTGYKHFLRIKLEGDRLTIFPIGLDEVPNRNDWELVDSRPDDQDLPAIIPKRNLKDIGQKVIEQKIVIELKDITTMKPSEE